LTSEFFLKSNPDLKWNEHTDKLTYQFKVPIARIDLPVKAESFSLDDIYKVEETFEEKNNSSESKKVIEQPDLLKFLKTKKAKFQY